MRLLVAVDEIAGDTMMMMLLLLMMPTYFSYTRLEVVDALVKHPIASSKDWSILRNCATITS